jgi:hypothetical protein
LLWTFKHPDLPQQQQRRHQNKTNDTPQDLSRSSHVPSKPLDQYTNAHPRKNLDKNSRNFLYRSSDDLDPELAQLDQRKNGLHAQSERHDAANLQSEDEYRFTSSYEPKSEGTPYNNSDLEHESKGAKGVDESDDAGDVDENHKDTTKHIRWAGYVWRRGMVPLWWQILVRDILLLIL